MKLYNVVWSIHHSAKQGVSTESLLIRLDGRRRRLWSSRDNLTVWPSLAFRLLITSSGPTASATFSLFQCPADLLEWAQPWGPPKKNPRKWFPGGVLGSLSTWGCSEEAEGRPSGRLHQNFTPVCRRALAAILDFPLSAPACLVSPSVLDSFEKHEDRSYFLRF